jgi:GH25 family lysozyme M1 (1,4-beta-N-acetylmuramidase)
VDISSNNPHPINFGDMVKAGVAGVYVKVSENTTYTNPYAAGDMASAVKAGLPFGTYDFARPTDNPIADAKHFVASGGGKGELPPTLDFETQTTSEKHDVAWALAWLKEVQALTGKTPIIYTGSYYWWAGSVSLNVWNLWLAAYPHGYHPINSACGLPSPRIPTAWAKQGWTIWQFTSRGKVSGIGGYSDLDVALPKWFSEITGAGVTPSTPKHPVPAPLYAPGSHGVTVYYVQHVLFSLHLLPKSGITGRYTLQTKVAVEKYQELMGISVDGLWGPATAVGNAWYLVNRRPVETLANYPLMKEGTAYHDKVKFVQTQLNKAGAHLAVDGVFSILTEGALIKFQKKHHVARFWYGTVDITTWRLLWKY